MQKKFTKAAGLLLMCASVTLGACEGSPLETVTKIYTKGGDTAVKATAIVLNAECKRSMENRQKFVAEINQRQTADGKTPRAIPQDCDGDGQRDF